LLPERSLLPLVETQVSANAQINFAKGGCWNGP
jgi:hypothetical protein